MRATVRYLVFTFSTSTTVHVRPLLPLAVAGAAGTMLATSLPAQTPATQAPQVTVGGVVFGQYLYQLKDSLGAGNQNQFSIQRAYLNVIGRFSGGLQTRVTADITPAGA